MKKHVITAFSMAIAVVFCMATQAIAAQHEQSTEMLASIGQEDLLFGDIPSVYSASKYEQKVTEAPSSVSVITSDEIKRYGYRSLAEILQSVRGFLVTYDRNYNYVNVRGFGIPGDYNSRILVLVDGHRQNDALYDSAFIGTSAPVDIDLIDRIEIVRGPSSSIYGTSAFFAVINIITKRGRDFQGVEVSGDYGSFDAYKVRGSFGDRFENGVELLLSASYYQSDGDDDLFYKEFDDPSTNNGVAEDLDSDYFYDIYGMITFQDFTLQASYHDRTKDVPTAPWDTAFNEDLWVQDKIYWLDLKYDHVLENDLNILARVSYNYYWYEGKYPYDWGPPDGIVPNRDRAEAEWLYGEIQARKIIMEKHNVILGGEYQNNYKLNQKNYDQGFKSDPYLDSKEDSYNVGIFVQDEYSMTDTLILNAGLRYDYYDSFGGTVNPRAALIYNPFEKTTFKAVYGQAFRAPSGYELYYDDGASTQIAPDDLDPETIQTFELIYEQYIGDNIRGTIVGSYYIINDLIALETDSANSVCYNEATDTYDAPCLIFNNVDKVTGHGFEIELEGKWESGLTNRLSYSYQNTRNDETDRRLVNSPQHLVKFNLTIPLVRDKIFLGFEEQYTGKLKTIANNETADYFITNVTLFSKNLVEDLEFSASVYNLFDETYSFPGSEEHAQDRIEQDGMTYRVKLTYLF